ncbi:SDR family NAD(P)-dependent oxidoreductase [Streptomyces sp. NPDC047974]|uniref:SDR family NAD(P)-dependent oxidoreductase n=1 Tax=Streptomyces sp. NPDC047974 TaxID=3154343 RepID=UPI003404D816
MSLPPPSPRGTALITGASSGIGAALARALASRGHGTTLVARDGDRLRRIAEELRGHGARVETVEADLTSRAERAELRARVERTGSTVHILINAAGAATRGSIAECDLEAELGHMELNVVSVVDLCRTFVDGMIARNSGAILNIASTAAFKPMGGQGTYTASKAFVLSFTRTLRLELRETPVTVTALCPGPVQTDFDRRAGFTAEEIGAIPSVMWKSADEVAAIAVDALERGAELCIPGRANMVDATMALLKAKQQASQAVSR